MSILARAYRGDSFDPKVAPKIERGKRHLPILAADAERPAASADEPAPSQEQDKDKS